MWFSISCTVAWLDYQQIQLISVKYDIDFHPPMLDARVYKKDKEVITILPACGISQKRFNESWKPDSQKWVPAKGQRHVIMLGYEKRALSVSQADIFKISGTEKKSALNFTKNWIETS